MLLDLLYLTKRHDEEDKMIIKMQKWPESFGKFLHYFTKYLFDNLIAVLYILVIFAKDKKSIILFWVIIALETHTKKSLAIIFRDPRPGLHSQELSYISCFCIFGDPSGHQSGTVNFYLIIFYLLVLKKNLKLWGKLICFIPFIAIVIFTGINRVYTVAHYMN